MLGHLNNQFRNSLRWPKKNLYFAFLVSYALQNDASQKIWLLTNQECHYKLCLNILMNKKDNEWGQVSVQPPNVF